MQILQVKCLQVNFQTYVVMEPNSHDYNGFTQVKEQALPCPGKGLADAQSESVMARDGMPTLPRTQRGRYNRGAKTLVHQSPVFYRQRSYYYYSFMETL